MRIASLFAIRAGVVLVAVAVIVVAIAAAVDQEAPQSKPETQSEAQTKDRSTPNNKNQRSKPWTVVGCVTDSAGKPMADVQIRAATGYGTLLGGGSTTTGGDGKFELHFGPGIRIIAEGPYCQAASVFASKTGFSERNLCRQGDCVAAISSNPDDQIDLGKLDTWGKPPERVFLPGVPKEINFVMVAAAKVSGRLVDSQNKPLEGYSISLTGKELPPSSSAIEQVHTDAEGSFAFKDIPQGFRFQFLVTPPNPKPPWLAWASIPMNFADPGDRQLRVIIQSGPSKSQLMARKFELQVIGDGTNWRRAVEEAQTSTRIRYPKEAEERKNGNFIQVETDKVQIVLGTNDSKQPDSKD
jgi:hypothetical protein